MTLVRERLDALGPRLLRGRAHLLNYAFNPMLIRDLRSVIRSRRPMWLQLGYLALTGLVMVVAALICHSELVSRSSSGWSNAGNVLYGQYMFAGIFEAQIVLLALIVIAHGAGAMSLEFEKRTYDMLAVTVLTSLELVTGKVLAITALGAMLLFTSLPLAAVCLLIGGVSPGQIVLCYGLLLASLPVWSASCLLISTLVRRSINSYVVCMVWITVWLIFTSFLSVPEAGFSCVGIWSPMLAVMADEYSGFAVLAHSLPAWLPPLLLNGLFTLLFIVLAAEALPLRVPSRSAVLRVLVAGCLFSLGFLMYSALLLPSGHPTGSPSPLADSLAFALTQGLQNAWLIAVAATVVVCSYRPPKKAYARGLSWFFGRVPLRRLLARDTAVGWRFVLALFALGVFAFALPAWVARGHKALPGPFGWSEAGYALLSTALYALSIFGFACWATAATLHWRDRRFTGCTIGLLFVATNLLVWVYLADPMSFGNAPSLAHPAVLTISPAAAVPHWLQPVPVVYYYAAAWKDPRLSLLLPLLYQLVFVLCGIVGVRWEARNLPREYASQ